MCIIEYLWERMFRGMCSSVRLGERAPAVGGVRGHERRVLRDAVHQGVRIEGALVCVGAPPRQRLFAVGPAKVVVAEGVLAAPPRLRWQALRRVFGSEYVKRRRVKILRSLKRSLQAGPQDAGFSERK